MPVSRFVPLYLETVVISFQFPIAKTNRSAVAADLHVEFVVPPYLVDSFSVYLDHSYQVVYDKVGEKDETKKSRVTSSKTTSAAGEAFPKIPTFCNSLRHIGLVRIEHYLT